MTGLSYALALVGLLCAALLSGPVAVVARDTSVKSFHAKRLEAIKRWELSARGHDSEGNARRATDKPAPPRVKNITFSNPKASSEYATAMLLPIIPSHFLLEFYVDGTTIPLVGFDVGPSWSGLIPISPDPHETRKVWLYRASKAGYFSLTISVVFLVLPPWSGRESGRSYLLVRCISCHGLQLMCN
jgi:carboxypeptidase D